MKRPILYTTLALLLASAAAACSDGAQTATVAKFNEQTTLVRIACLDANGDTTLDGADAQAGLPLDVNGDGAIDGADAAIVEGVSIRFPDGAAEGCPDDAPEPDWQVSATSDVNCDEVSSGVLLFGIGGGDVDLNNNTNAAGVRWMLYEIGQSLEDAGVSYQLASVAPQISGAEAGHTASEEWTSAYLEQTLNARPCLRVVLLGHSHGGVAATTAAARLEAAGLGDRIVLTAPVDRFEALYQGSTDLPQQSPVFNVYITEGEFIGEPIEQPNIENLDATQMGAPSDGERGGASERVTHTTVDNSPDVLEEIRTRVVEATSG